MAAESKATFFNISASSLTSKWLGDSEKLVRALFAMARYLQPAVIFIDEIDSLLSERSNNEHEASRRLKTEFLVQFDGAATTNDDKIIVMGATNRPQDLDEAARRRLVKRIYVPLPSEQNRVDLISNLLSKEVNVKLTKRQLEKLATLTEGYSCSDLTSLCKDAALEPIRELGMEIRDISTQELRPLVLDDFKKALQHVRPSVSKDSIAAFEKWNKEFGSIGI